VKQQEERNRQLKKELRAAREENCKLKAENVSSNFVEQDNSGIWGKGGNKYNSRSHRFSANYACQDQINN
jgi:hypothetical protein